MHGPVNVKMSNLECEINTYSTFLNIYLFWRGDVIGDFRLKTLEILMLGVRPNTQYFVINKYVFIIVLRFFFIFC